MLFLDLLPLLSDFFLRVFFNAREDQVQLAFTKAELGHYIDEQLESAEDQVDSEIQIFQNALDFHNVKATRSHDSQNRDRGSRSS